MWISTLIGMLLWLALSLLPLGAKELSGEQLVKSLNCLACHALGGQGGNRGPSWDGLGRRLTEEAIRKQLISPKGRMPSFAHLRPDELEALVEFLSGIK